MWTVSVSEALPCYDRLFALLSAEEQARAARFLHQAPRDEFVTGRGCLRLLLGYHLQCPPRAVAFSLGPLGKPETPGVHFNLSHAGGMVAIAVSLAGPVGIDVEHEDRTVEVLDVAETVFHAEELAHVRAASTVKERRRRFFLAWTALEAKAKCLGVGLAHLQTIAEQKDFLKVTCLSVPKSYFGALCRSQAESTVCEEILKRGALEWLLDCR